MKRIIDLCDNDLILSAIARFIIVQKKTRVFTAASFSSEVFSSI
jgi:hypothetical protein